MRDESHVTLLAASDVGYKNLTTLISKGFLEGYYYKPRIDLDLLAAHNEGLIVLSGCMSSLVSAPLLKNDYETAKKNAKVFGEIFGDRFYIEIMRHGMPEEDAINAGLIKLARELSFPLVATNDSHYLTQGDAQAHDVLLCIGTGKTVQDTSRMKFFSDQFYVKSADEMRELFADIPEACDNTLEIVKRIDIKIPKKIFYLPDYPVPKTPAEDVAGVLGASSAPDAAPGSMFGLDPHREIPMSAEDYLRLVCEQGFVARYGTRAGDDRRGAARAPGVRAGRHQHDGVRLVLSHRVGFHQVRARPRHSGRSGPRLGGRLGRLVLPADHRPRPDQVRADLRAVPEPRAHLDAGYRHRLLRRAARRSDPLRHRQVRQGPRRADRHLRYDGGAGGDSRRRPRAGRPAARTSTASPSSSRRGRPG